MGKGKGGGGKGGVKKQEPSGGGKGGNAPAGKAKPNADAVKQGSKKGGKK